MPNQTAPTQQTQSEQKTTEWQKGPENSCNYCLGARKVWVPAFSGYDVCPDCHGDGCARRKYLGEAWERVQVEDGSFKTCKMELWRNIDGERSFGRVLEVRS